MAREIDGAKQYYLFNAHGDVVHRVDETANVLKTYKYDAFGSEENPEPLDTNPFRYCGEYFDRETETYYLRARNYDPRTGRFGSEDCLKSGLNWYIYCGNNPIFFVDPSGLAYITQGTKFNTYTSHNFTDAQKSFQRHKGSNPVWIDQGEDTIDIYARIRIVEDPSQSLEWNSAYRKAALEGIADSWKGEYNGKAVRVLLGDISDLKSLKKEQNYLTIGIHAGEKGKGSYVDLPGPAESWNKERSQTMVLYNSNPYMASYSETMFRETAGHEFGHVLGIGDAYNMGAQNQWLSWGATPSLMNNQFNVSGAQAIDYQKMLEAQSSNKWQK